MIINRSFKYRIYLTKNQKEKFESLYSKCTILFNLLLKVKEKRIFENEDEGIFIKDFTKKNPELNNGNFTAYISVYHLINKIIKKYKDGYIQEFPCMKNINKYPKKIHFDIKTKYNFNDLHNKITLDKIGTFKIKYHRPLPTNFYLRNVIIEEKNKDEFYINLGVSELIVDKNKEILGAVGLDYSSPHLFVTSDNEYGDKYQINNYLIDKIKRTRRQMHKCKFGSKNYLKKKYLHEKLNQKVANKRAYLLNQAANYLLSKYDLIGVETLSLAKIAQNHHLGKQTYQNAYDTFIKILEYKAIMLGKKVIKVPEFYPSSKICSNCGQLNNDLTLEDRIYSCSCGFEIDRDLNAAINIRNKAVSIYEEKMFINEKRRTASIKKEI